jgi:hypothetical protein
LVVPFIETMELLHMQGPKSNINAIGDYLRADAPSEGKFNYFNSVPNSRERERERERSQLHVKTNFYVHSRSAFRVNGHGPTWSTCVDGPCTEVVVSRCRHTFTWKLFLRVAEVYTWQKHCGISLYVCSSSPNCQLRTTEQSTSFFQFGSLQWHCDSEPHWRDEHIDSFSFYFRIIFHVLGAALWAFKAPF